MMNWPPAKLKYVARFGYGDTLPHGEQLDGIFRVYGSNGPYSSFSRANTGGPAIIVGRKGSYGKVNWTEEPCFASDTTFFVDYSTTQNDLRWLYWLFQTLHLDEGSDEAAVPGLNRDSAYSKDVVVPPLPQQRAIADYLDRETARIDALVATKEQVLTLLAEKRRALISCAVTRGLDPNVSLRDAAIPGVEQIPAHWGTVRLRYLTTGIEQGWSPESANTQPNLDEWGVLKLNAVNRSRFDETAAKTLPADVEPRTDLEIRRGDVLVTRSNTPGLVGDACYVETTRPRLMLSDIIYRLTVNFQVVDGKFLVYFLTIPAGRIQIKKDARGTSASMVKISQNHIKNWRIPVPPLNEQHATTDYLDRETAPIDELVTKTRETIALLKERRSSLIAAAVAGQVDMEHTV